jgi:hypothetical protein
MDHPTDSLKQAEQSRGPEARFGGNRYVAARIVLLGKARKMIRGATSSNYADHGADFYYYGE